MAGSTFGSIFRITTWGESHGAGIGVVVDGCPAGIPLNEEIVQIYLDRRKPGQGNFTTSRKESDQVHILSGVFEGKTSGTPISMVIRNENQRSGDYSYLADCYRPGHADFTYDMKYGFRDYRGGGRSSGRETAARVAGGAVAMEFLKMLGISFTSYVHSIGPIVCDPAHFDKEEIFKNEARMPDPLAAEKASAYLAEMKARMDSVGGTVRCIAHHVPVGLGDPVFDKLDANLGKAIFSIGGVKAVEIGEGIHAAELTGSQNNDPFIPGEAGTAKATNHAGGVLGGISNGSDLVITASFKPAPSIGQEQMTVNQAGEPVTLAIHGRHDPTIVSRAVAVVEAMTALTIADALLLNMSAQAEKVKEFYKR